MTHLKPLRCLVALLALALAIPATAGLSQYQIPGGGEWGNEDAWDAGEPPTKGDTAYFGYKMGKKPATITFAADGTAKNLNGDTNGPASLTFEMGGHTLSFTNQSEVKSPMTITDGTWELTNTLVIHETGSLTLGEGATIKATGAAEQINVRRGGTLILEGGSVEPMTSLRDVTIGPKATLELKSGLIKCRAMEMKTKASFIVTVPTGGFVEAPVQVQKTIGRLAGLTLKAADDYTHESGATFPLMSFGETCEATFTDLAEGASITDDKGNKFKISYEDMGEVTLTAE